MDIQFLANNMDRMRISGIGPLPVVLSQKKHYKKLKYDIPKCKNKLMPKGLCNKPTKLHFQYILESVALKKLCTNQPKFAEELEGLWHQEAEIQTRDLY